MPDSGQVTSSAAEFYDEFFVPALFARWVPGLIAAARLAPGMRVLDVACGTGVAAVEAQAAVSPGGSTIGLDLNPGMLAIARRKTNEVLWREGAAEALPLGDASFDAVISQFGLMFFSDKKAALAEMWRVLRPGGRLVVAVWGALDDTPRTFDASTARPAFLRFVHGSNAMSEAGRSRTSSTTSNSSCSSTKRKGRSVASSRRTAR